jgi:hypothetical protein
MLPSVGSLQALRKFRPPDIASVNA